MSNIPSYAHNMSWHSWTGFIIQHKVMLDHIMPRSNAEKSAFLKHEIETQLGADETQRSNKKRWSWIWVATVAAFLCSIAVNIWLARRSRYGAFPTDMKDARRAIKYETRTYTGALIFDPEKRGLVRLQEPGVVEYFGPPSKAVDDAWHNLLHDQFPIMTDEEAKPYLPNLTRLETGHYHFE